MTYSYEYPRPSVTVDGLVFRIIGNELEILLIQRKKSPFKNQWAFPGGFMEIDETPEDGVIREVQEETGIVLAHVIQLGAYGAVERDPRGRTVSIAFISFVDDTAEAKAADDAADAKWMSLKAVDKKQLAFDHSLILKEAILFLKGRATEERMAEDLRLRPQDIKKVAQFFRSEM